MNVLRFVLQGLLVASIALALLFYAFPSRHLSRGVMLIAGLLVSAVIASLLGRRP